MVLFSCGTICFVLDNIIALLYVCTAAPNVDSFRNPRGACRPMGLVVMALSRPFQVVLHSTVHPHAYLTIYVKHTYGGKPVLFPGHGAAAIPENDT